MKKLTSRMPPRSGERELAQWDLAHPDLTPSRFSAQISSSTVAAMQAFDSAVALGSFKAAAEVLHLTPSAVSHRIRRLEAILGTRLFERTNRRVRPTVEGQALAVLTGRAFAELSRALTRAGERAERRVLRISVFPLFASAWLMPRLAEFVAKHPDIELAISTSTRLVDLETESVDAVVRSGSGRWPGLAAIPLMPLHITLLASPSMEKRLRLRVARDLASAPLIQMSDFADAWPDWFERRQLTWTQPKRTVWVAGFEAALLAAERGVGVALGLWPLCSASIDSGRLVELLPPRDPATSCWLVYRDSDVDHAPLAIFRKWLKSELKNKSQRPSPRPHRRA